MTHDAVSGSVTIHPPRSDYECPRSPTLPPQRPPPPLRASRSAAARCPALGTCAALSPAQPRAPLSPHDGEGQTLDARVADFVSVERNPKKVVIRGKSVGKAPRP